MSTISKDFSRAKLVEEMGELMQLIGKLQAFPKGKHPDGKGPIMRRIQDEVSDVYAALRYFINEHELKNFSTISRETEAWKRTQEKIKLYKKWGKEREIV